MKAILISGASLSGETYKPFIGYLLNKADAFSYEIIKTADKTHDEDDQIYYTNIKKAENVFQNFYKEKNHDGRYNLKSFVYLNNHVVKDYLKKESSIYHWNYPNGIENLCFYQNNRCFFESVTYENYFVYYTESSSGIEDLEKLGAALQKYLMNNSENTVRR